MSIGQALTDAAMALDDPRTDELLEQFLLEDKDTWVDRLIALVKYLPEKNRLFIMRRIQIGEPVERGEPT